MSAVVPAGIVILFLDHNRNRKFKVYRTLMLSKGNRRIIYSISGAETVPRDKQDFTESLLVSLLLN